MKVRSPGAPPIEAARRLFGKSSGPFGFGTGYLHHAADRATSVRLLKEAYEQGVRWFDTARLYGEGRCEGMIAEALGPVRHEIILVTKVGILPPPRDLATRIRGKAAATLGRLPPLRSLIPPPVQEPEFGVFDPARMQQSLETSLRELRTDHVDLLLLHECTPDDVRRADVVGFLGQVIAQGKARAWGVAPRAADMLAIAAQNLPYGDAAQFEASLRGDFPPAGTAPPSLVITHSSLGQRFQDTARRLREDPALQARWASALEMDMSDSGAVAQVFLAHAAMQNPGGIVLFSTTRPERLKSNLQAEALLPPPGQEEALSSLITLS